MVNTGNADKIDIDLWRAGKPEGLKLMNEKLNKMVDNADNFDIDLWRAGRATADEWDYKKVSNADINKLWPA